MFEHKQLPTILGALTLVCTSWLACSKEDAQSQQADGRRPSGKQGASSSHTGGPPGAGGPGEGRPAAAVPVEVSKVVRRSISSYLGDIHGSSRRLAFPAERHDGHRRTPDLAIDDINDDLGIRSRGKPRQKYERQP